MHLLKYTVCCCMYCLGLRSLWVDFMLLLVTILKPLPTLKGMVTMYVLAYSSVACTCTCMCMLLNTFITVSCIFMLRSLDLKKGQRDVIEAGVCSGVFMYKKSMHGSIIIHVQ